MITTYRRALSVPGAVRFSAAGVLARLPIAMMGIGIVLLVTDQTGSYATAGQLTAVYVLGNAIGALPIARLVDSAGQRRVLLPAGLVSATALALMVVAVTEEWPWVVAYAAAAVAGISFPNVGSAVRARWAYAVRDRDTLQTAFAWEAVADETVFILGPTLVTLLAAALDPVVALALAGGALLSGTLWLTSQRASEPPVPAPSNDRDRGVTERAMPWGGLMPLVAAAFLLGAMFGACEVATIALADEQDRPFMAGVILALWAVGSLVAGLVTGAMGFRRSAPARLRGGLLGLAVLMAPTPFVTDLGGMAVLLLFAGLAIAPTLIAATSWIESLVPSRRLNEGLAVFHTALVVGVAPGAAITGLVVDRAGASASYWVPAGSAMIGAVAGAFTLLVAEPSPRETDATGGTEPSTAVGTSGGQS